MHYLPQTPPAAPPTLFILDVASQRRFIASPPRRSPVNNPLQVCTLQFLPQRLIVTLLSLMRSLLNVQFTQRCWLPVRLAFPTLNLSHPIPLNSTVSLPSLLGRFFYFPFPSQFNVYSPFELHVLCCELGLAFLLLLLAPLQCPCSSAKFAPLLRGTAFSGHGQ